MKALILDGSRSLGGPLATINNEVTLLLEKNGWEVESFHLLEENIATCVGCFGCWLKTPGECIIKDKGPEIAKKIVQSDLRVYITPITFGGYSYQLKKMIDRLLPTTTPFFKIIKGEIHHVPRYRDEKSNNQIWIGYLPQQDPESANIFKKLTERNNINMYCSNPCVEIFTGDVEDLDLSKISRYIEDEEAFV